MERERISELLNSFLRTELAAVKSYERVLGHAGASGDGSDSELMKRVVEPLQRIQEEHREAARLLGAEIVERGSEPRDTSLDESDAMDALAQVSGSPLEDPYALKALKEREEQALVSYEAALAQESDGALGDDVRELVEKMLLPRTREHLPIIDGLLAAA